MTTNTLHRPSLIAFLRQAFSHATNGGPLFYAWMTLLTCVALVGVNAWACLLYTSDAADE